MTREGKVYTVGNEVTLWVAEGGGSIMIKTREPYGDPVELGEAETSELVEILQKLIQEIR